MNIENTSFAFFGDPTSKQKTDYNKAWLGGKGAHLTEMSELDIPVPPGFIITTDISSYYYAHENSYPIFFAKQLKQQIAHLEKVTSKKFGSKKNPLLVSVRSGAPVSMPGMMDTILNLGLNTVTIESMIRTTNNATFVYDSYRRFIQMFGNVVMKVDGNKFETIMEDKKKLYGVEKDSDLNVKQLKEIIKLFKQCYKRETSKDIPENPMEQLQYAIDAVFTSWYNPRAEAYRKMYHISSDIGTAVNIQSMVFGNMGETSGTGVLFTRNPATGKKKFFGEFLLNAQGEDVVAGIRTPSPIEELADTMPDVYKQLSGIGVMLEKHYKDMQDIEFTIEEGKLYILQTRNAKRTAIASLHILCRMQKEGLLNKRDVIKRMDPNTLPALLANIFDIESKKLVLTQGLLLAKGLPAGPGAATGAIALSVEEVIELKKKNIPSILVRTETSPEDIAGMHLAEGILTARGGMTSHAAVIARGMNKPCIVGCKVLHIDTKKRHITFHMHDNSTKTIPAEERIALDGFTGEVIHAELKAQKSEIEQVIVDKTLDIKQSKIATSYKKVMKWAQQYAQLMVRTNADTPKDAATARSYGAQGIGLCRTEHMFFGADRILLIRKVILSDNPDILSYALDQLHLLQKQDFKEILEIMHDLPVTIRLLDPPLHEFLPHDNKAIALLANELKTSISTVTSKIQSLQESNPMLGHRGCRLGITHPDITVMQTKAIIEATCELKQQGIIALPEIMIPLVGHHKEFQDQANIVHTIADKTQKEMGIKIEYKIGTMIEVPRAAITANKIAKKADFFSFGTNDLTQMGSGFSRDDCQSFLPLYIQKQIYQHNPFEVLDTKGIGKLIKLAIKLGRKKKSYLKIGVCGEHGGDPSSIQFFNKQQIDYISCSPYRVSIAILSAAQAHLKQKKNK